MKIVIKAIQIELTESLENYVNQKFSTLAKLVKSFEVNGELTLRVELARTTRHHNKGDVYYVESTLPIVRNLIRIEQIGQDMHAAIDVAKDRMKVEIEKFKERTQSKDKKEIDRLKNK
jgi:ribosomal subunit interface protein